MLELLKGINGFFGLDLFLELRNKEFKVNILIDARFVLKKLLFNIDCVDLLSDFADIFEFNIKCDLVIPQKSFFIGWQESYFLSFFNCCQLFRRKDLLECRDLLLKAK